MMMTNDEADEIILTSVANWTRGTQECGAVPPSGEPSDNLSSLVK